MSGGHYSSLLAALALALCLCAGCGGKKQDNIDAGMEAVEKLDYETALDCFEKAMVNGEDLRLLYRGQGLAYMGLTRYDEAATSLEKALSCSDGRVDDIDYDINYYLATAYYKLDQPAQAAGVYQAVLALRPKETNAWYLRGTVRISQGDFEGADADFKEALRLAPSDYDLLINIYCILADNGYKQAGGEYLKAALEKDTKSMTDYVRGRISYYLEDYENAKNYLEKARDTGGYEAVLLLGRTYETQGDYNYAVSVYNTFLDKDQTQAAVYNQLGLCRMKMGAYAEALEAFQSGMKIEGNELMQTLKFNEIAANEYLGEYKKAAVLMDAYRTAYPDDETAVREEAFLKTR